MTVDAWVNKTARDVRNLGLWRGLHRGVQEACVGAMRRLGYEDRGEYIWERDWDVLVLLDACRPDTLSAVCSEYEFVPSDVPTFYSKASSSRIWMEKNFSEEFAAEMSATRYVCGNPYSGKHLDSRDFGQLDEVWRYGWDEEQGGMPARPITDRAVETRRRNPTDRLIVHYMQPHFPSFPDPLGSQLKLETFDDSEEWDSVWDRLEGGQISTERVRRSYRENLRYVLDDVEVLLRSIDADRVVISADHANAFGEWGQFGHPYNSPIAAIRRVPWVTVSASDSGEYEPTTEYEAPSEETTTDVDERLSNLGYL
ncbi:hypothetical protein SAMN05216278_1422 [Halopelagius longus]|uniref:Uncharacterized protein n=2 Tax=Halopelagius longus TaxID=1236180 RepID=A0A1H1ANC7_9EURY|nr:hypothetical protein SAMN05216278_1422 [Halopelagius longus]